VNGILERLPQAQRPEALRVCRTIIERCGENAPEALRRFAAIASSERFTPSMLGTVSLIATRAGPDVVSTLTAFERLLSSEKFNRHVHEAARLSIIRAGQDSTEALRALYFLVENPSFSGRALDVALPDRFVRFLDTAMRAGGGEAYMAIRCMGSLFCNPAFGPADLSPRSAESFSRQIRQVRSDSPPYHLDALEALSTLLANSAIDPHAISPEVVADLIRMTHVISEGYPSTTPQRDDPMRMFRLIIGNRRFSLGMIASDGVFSSFLSSSTPASSSSLSVFLDFMHAIRRNPRALEIASELARSENPADCMRLLIAISSNPSLSPFLEMGDAAQRIIRIAASLRSCYSVSADDAGGVGSRASGVQLLADLARDERVTLQGFQRLLTLSQSLGPQADAGLYIVRQYLAIPPEQSQGLAAHRAGADGSRMVQRSFPSDDELAAIPALIAQAGSLLPPAHAPAHSGEAIPQSEEVHPWYQMSHMLGAIVNARGFRMSMLGRGGLLPLILDRCFPDDALPAMSRFAVILDSRDYAPGMEAFLESIIRPMRRSEAVSERNVFRTLNIFFDLMGVVQPDDRFLPALAEALRSHPALADSAMQIYGSLLRNESFAGLLENPAFARRVVTMAAMVGSGHGRHTFMHEFEILAVSDDSFTPELFARIERLIRIAGPDSGSVLRAIVQAHRRGDNSPGQTLQTMLSNENLSFIIAMVRVAPTDSRDDVASAIGAAFRELSGRRTGQEIALQHRLLQTYQEFIRGAGDQAGALARVFPHAMDSVISRQSINPSQVMMLSLETARHYGEWARAFLAQVPQDHREEAVVNISVLFGSILSDERLSGLLFERPQSFEAGRQLAQRLIGGFISPEVGLNFAYAIETIGAERAATLYRRFGIRHFARYSPQLLNRLYERAKGRSTRPAVLAVFPDSDYNGAFYSAGRRLDGLLGDFDVILYERDTESGFFAAAADFRRSFGQTPSIIIGGHGSPESIRLGNETDEGMLDLTDRDKMGSLRDVLLPNSSMVLVSCSTGRDENSIGAMLSRLLGTTLYAPTTPSNVSEFRASDGRVRATFVEQTGVFSSGRQTAGKRK
jgi:hypothetical protein